MSEPSRPKSYKYNPYVPASMGEMEETSRFSGRVSLWAFSLYVLANLLLPFCMIWFEGSGAVRAILAWAHSVPIVSDRFNFLVKLSKISANSYLVVLLSAIPIGICVGTLYAVNFKHHAINTGNYVRVDFRGAVGLVSTLAPSLFIAWYLTFLGTPPGISAMDGMDHILLWPYFWIVSIFSLFTISASFFWVPSVTLKFIDQWVSK